MSTPKFALLITPLILLASSGCNNGGGGGSNQRSTASFSRDVATEWFDLLTASIDAENLNPPQASRIIGYAGVTLYESVVSGMQDGQSLGGQLNGLPALPSLPAGGYHWPSVANEALATVLTNLFSGASAPTLQSIADLKAQFEADFALEAGSTVIGNSMARGQVVATAIDDWIAGDGYATNHACAYTVPAGTGLWVPTPPAFVANPLEPCWGEMRTSVLLFAAECSPLSYPAFSMDGSSKFAAEAMEVYTTGNNLTQDQKDIATFWADGAGSITPPGHWVSITGQLLALEGSKLDVAAEAYVRVGLAVMDAFISTWELKYYYNLLRPVTYIRDPAGPINDPAWSSFIGTPPFPEFTSGHSTQSGAAAYVLTALFGPLSFTDNTYPPGRTFNTIDEAAQEAAISRLYGGIHYRSAIERGIEQGRCIGQTILQSLEFTKP